MVTRVATYTSHSLLSNLALQNAAKVTDLQTQASSGQKSREYAGISDSTQRLLNLESEYGKTSQYLSNATQAKLRLENMEASVDTMSDLTVKMRSLLIQAQNNNLAGDINLANEANQALAQVESLLNTQLDGRSLFSGGRTNQNAVDIASMEIPDTYYSTNSAMTGTATLASLGVTANGDLNVNGNTVNYQTTDTVNDLIAAINGFPPANASLRSDPGTGTIRLVVEDLSGGTLAFAEGGLSTGNLFNVLAPLNAPNPRADVSYYKGDQQQLTARIDDDYSIEYGVRADAPAFEKLIRSLKIMSTTQDSTSLNIALGLINEATDELPNIQAKIGVDISTIERKETQHKDFAVFAANAISNIETVDVPLTLAELSQYETALQASFMSISRSSELSLVNFLR
ncbi:hypothetical protein AUP42_05095 [Thalassospira lucentensis]|uniref:Flagellar hook-associated protein 3 FlgL n=2 Tax=Thalassospira TaxID=168934 RepID=A0A285RMN8_9PROT|nr:MULTISPECIES: flagellin [Thalassospira]KZB62322.1 hypothetical protein AUP42_05095 [Thalassospira lucentensis]MCH2275094.1 hypothetical protein [Thalassospira sp.]SOB95385.1 flagellar hook-associated protein 3 FlgL [Thalassospira xiamenensis]